VKGNEAGMFINIQNRRKEGEGGRKRITSVTKPSGLQKRRKKKHVAWKKQKKKRNGSFLKKTSRGETTTKMKHKRAPLSREPGNPAREGNLLGPAAKKKTVDGKRIGKVPTNRKERGRKRSNCEHQTARVKTRQNKNCRQTETGTTQSKKKKGESLKGSRSSLSQARKDNGKGAYKEEKKKPAWGPPKQHSLTGRERQPALYRVTD